MRASLPGPREVQPARGDEDEIGQFWPGGQLDDDPCRAHLDGSKLHSGLEDVGRAELRVMGVLEVVVGEKEGTRVRDVKWLVRSTS